MNINDLERFQEFIANIKANTEKALELINEIGGPDHQCPFSFEAKCTKPENKTCSEFDCPVWTYKVLGREADQHIADNLKDYWKYQGTED